MCFFTGTCGCAWKTRGQGKPSSSCFCAKEEAYRLFYDIIPSEFKEIICSPLLVWSKSFLLISIICQQTSCKPPGITTQHTIIIVYFTLVWPVWAKSEARSNLLIPEDLFAVITHLPMLITENDILPQLFMFLWCVVAQTIIYRKLEKFKVNGLDCEASD